jgi:RNA polymerase sigma-70 factor (ECF subfamily)
MSTTSLSLLNRAAAGDDPQSWDRLTRLYRPLLQRWVTAFGIQYSDTQDLIQEVLATVVRELPGFRHNERKGAFRKWLKGILINRVRHFLRSRRSRPIATGKSSVLEQLEQLADDHSELSQLWDREHNAHIISRLTDSVEARFERKTWMAFRRQVIDGVSPDEVSAELKMPLSSVYVAKSRVLSALRQEAEGLID